MRLLVAFGSTEGQTRKIAHHIDTSVQALGHTCVTHNCLDLSALEGIESFDAITVAASVHDQHHQEEVSDFVKANIAALQAKPSAFISVSLSIALSDGKEEAQKYVTEFSEETGWTPKHVHMAAGAIRFIEYDFFKTFTIEQIVMKGHKMPGKSGGNPEFTDWEALDEFVKSLLDAAAA